MAQFLTSVALACDAPLRGQPELLLQVQDCLLPLVEIGPEEAQRIGGLRLISLWLDAVALSGMDGNLDEFTGAALFQAIKTSGEAFLQRALEKQVRPKIWTSVANFAVVNNMRGVVHLLHDHVANLRAPNALEIAAGICDLKTIQWLANMKFGRSRATDRTLARAAATGKLHVVKWMRKNLKFPDYDTAVRRAMMSSARFGKLRVLQWLVDATKIRWPSTAIAMALIEGQYEKADWMYERWQEWVAIGIGHTSYLDMAQATDKAFKDGDLQLAEWLRQRNQLNIWRKGIAVSNGQVHVLDYVEKNCPDCDWEADLFNKHSAYSGSLAAAQWALDRGLLSTDMDVLSNAAVAGHIEFAEWFVSAVQPVRPESPDTQIVARTAAEGHFDCVCFLVKQGFGVANRDAVYSAACEGHLEVAQWLLTHYLEETGADASPESIGLLALENALCEAAVGGHIDTVHWLHGLGVRFDDQEMIVKVASEDHLDVVQFIVNHSREGDRIPGALDAAIRGSHLRVVKYLVAQCSPVHVNSQRLSHVARDHGHIRLANWISLNVLPRVREGTGWPSSVS